MAPASARAKPGPWDSPAQDAFEIRMTAPRSALPVQGKYLLVGAGIVAALVSLRFVLLGAWPVLIFSVLDIGALAVALNVFGKGPVPEERLRIRDGQIELIRLDTRGRHSRLAPRIAAALGAARS